MLVKNGDIRASSFYCLRSLQTNFQIEVNILQTHTDIDEWGERWGEIESKRENNSKEKNKMNENGGKERRCIMENFIFVLFNNILIIVLPPSRRAPSLTFLFSTFSSSLFVLCASLITWKSFWFAFFAWRFCGIDVCLLFAKRLNIVDLKQTSIEFVNWTRETNTHTHTKHDHQKADDVWIFVSGACERTFESIVSKQLQSTLCSAPKNASVRLCWIQNTKCVIVESSLRSVYSTATHTHSGIEWEPKGKQEKKHCGSNISPNENDSRRKNQLLLPGLFRIIRNCSNSVAVKSEKYMEFRFFLLFLYSQIGERPKLLVFRFYEK